MQTGIHMIFFAVQWAENRPSVFSLFAVKLGFTEVSIIFLISAQNIGCGYSLEPPRRGVSNVYDNLFF